MEYKPYYPPRRRNHRRTTTPRDYFVTFGECSFNQTQEQEPKQKSSCPLFENEKEHEIHRQMETGCAN